jgi:SAM-dependent methyltransferase
MQKYIHGTSEKEQERLSLLNRITNGSFIRYLGNLDNKTICDFGCGVGNLIADIAAKHPSARITGLEISRDQLKSARLNNRDHPQVTFVHADVMANNLPDDAFDLVWCRYLLEHVADPIGVVKEMLRVAKAAGTVACQENDLANVVYFPEIEGLDLVMRRFCDLQITLGGDPFIGRKLFDIFKRAGARDIRLSFEPEIYTEDDPEGYRAWLGNAHDILYGARDELLGRTMIDEATLETSLAEMKRRIRRPVGVALFYWNRIVGQKGVSES